MKKFIEAHNGLSAILVDKSKYDGVWVSSLTESAAKGMPDNELLSPSHRLDTVREIRNVTSKPIMVDWDTGGSVEHFPFWVRQLELAGADIIMIEDKIFPKKNSLLEEAKQVLEDVDIFCTKIKAGKSVSNKVKIFARIESLIAKKSVSDALIRANAYVGVGADGIMIHSKVKVDCSEILEFASEFKKIFPDVPLVAVPTTYDLPPKHQFEYVVYANHLLRVALKAMKEAVDSDDIKNLPMAEVNEIFDLVGK